MSTPPFRLILSFLKWKISRLCRNVAGTPSLFWLGLVLPICAIAGVTSNDILTQWPLLSIALLPVLWRRQALHVLHWLGILLVLYAAASIAWADIPADAVFGLWQVLIWGLAFWLGTTSESLEPLWRGMATGLLISSGFALANAFGWQGIVTYGGEPAGLLFNRAVASAAFGIVMVALICHDHWRLALCLVPGLVLAQSRGGFLILMAGLLARYLNWKVVLFFTLTVAAFAVSRPGVSDTLRIQTWLIGWNGSKLFGNGIGSFVDLFVIYPDHTAYRLEYAHNEYIQAIYELGIGSLALFAIHGAALLQVQKREWPTFAAFSVLCGFYFPLHAGYLAIIGPAVAGHLLRRDGPGWYPRPVGRHPVVSGLFAKKRRYDAAGGKTIPV